MNKIIFILLLAVIFLSCSNDDENLSPLLITLQKEYNPQKLGIKKEIYTNTDGVLYNSIGILITDVYFTNETTEDIEIHSSKIALMLYRKLNKHQLEKYDLITIYLGVEDNSDKYSFNFNLLKKINEGIVLIEEFNDIVNNKNYDKIPYFFDSEYLTETKKINLINRFKELDRNGQTTDIYILGFFLDKSKKKYVIAINSIRKLEKQYYLTHFYFKKDRQEFKTFDGISI